MLAVPFLALALTLSAQTNTTTSEPAAEEAPVTVVREIDRRPTTPVIAALNAVTRPFVVGGASLAVGVVSGLLTTGWMALSLIFMTVAYIQADGVPEAGLPTPGETVDLNRQEVIEGIVWDLGRYGLISALGVGAVAFLVTFIGVGLILGGVVVGAE